MEGKSYKQIKQNLAPHQQVRNMNISNDAKFSLMVSEYLTHREDMRSKKCPKCWLLLHGRAGCICSKFKPLDFSVNVRFLIFIHYKEWFNAGDDSKILLNAASDLSKVYVYGREQDMIDLKNVCDDTENSSTMLLYPSDIAIDVNTYLSRVDQADLKNNPNNPDNPDNPDESQGKTINIMVLDGTWNQV